jgi:hypothetical protein
LGFVVSAVLFTPEGASESSRCQDPVGIMFGGCARAAEEIFHAIRACINCERTQMNQGI